MSNTTERASSAIGYLALYGFYIVATIGIAAVSLGMIKAIEGLIRLF